MMKSPSVLGQLKTESAMSSMNIKGLDVQKKQTSAVSAAIKIPKPIYTMYFRTSQYNSLGEKINAMGSWAAVKKSNGLSITNDALATEHFDDYETKGFTAPNGASSYPPLLGIDIPWDNNRQNDKAAADNIYANSFTLAFKQVTTDYGYSWVREFGGRPVKSIDLSKLASDKPLSTAETGEPVPAPVKSVSSGGGMMIKLPVSNVNSNSSSQSMVSYQTIVWNREQYLQADYKLLKDFAYSVSLNAGAFYNWSPAKAESLLGNMGGNVDFASNGLGGYMSMPWNKFYYLYTDNKYMAIVNALKTVPYTDYPKGSRAIQFSYKAGKLQGSSINKTFTY
jgi:hypothetical protein